MQTPSLMLMMIIDIIMKRGGKVKKEHSPISYLRVTNQEPNMRRNLQIWTSLRSVIFTPHKL